jgi:hypothetical protein
MPEMRDVWPRALLLFGASLLVFIAVSGVALRLIFDFRPGWPIPAPGQRAQVEPELQTAPRLDLAALRRREDAELARLGWVDRAAGIARIPIEDAMRIIAQRGLPRWGQPAVETADECGLLEAQVPRAPQAERCRAAAPSGQGSTP